MVRTAAILIVFVIYSNISPALSRELKREKCSIHDNGCLKELYHGVIMEAAEKGFPDLGIPVLDPYKSKSFEVTILDLLKVQLSEVVVKGLKSCELKNLDFGLEKKISTAKLECKLVSAEGKYSITPAPILSVLLGSIKIHGDGLGSVTAENLKAEVDVPFLIKKNDLGDLYYELENDKIVVTKYEVGKAQISIDNFYVGSQEISNIANNIINENWEFFIKTAAEQISRVAIDIFAENGNKYFTGTPIKDLVKEDLSAYATK